MRRTGTDGDASTKQTADDAMAGKVSAAALGYFQDPFAPLFVRHHPPRRPPIINRGNFARVASIDKLMRSFLSSSDLALEEKEPPPPPQTPAVSAAASAERRKGRQIVSLGAGKDTTFFRLLQDGIAPPGGYFEVDFPDMMRQKLAVIKHSPVLRKLLDVCDEGFSNGTTATAGPIANGSSTAPTAAVAAAAAVVRLAGGRYRLVAADLRDAPAAAAALLAAGADGDAPTFFLAECVLAYVEPERARALLEWIAPSFRCAAMASYDMTRPDDAFGRVMVANIQERGCSLPGLAACPSLAMQERRFLQAGFDSASAADMLAVFHGFVDPAEVQRVSAIEPLDELEEWQLIMTHYCMVVATNGQAAGRWLAALGFPPGMVGGGAT
ncbi:unnamed protein product [Phaeothamnion confervicola]